VAETTEGSVVTISYGRDYPDEPWLDEDGSIIEPTDGRKPSEIHSGQTKFAYLLAERCALKIMHVHQVGWYYWDSSRWKRDDKGRADREVHKLVREFWTKAMGDKELQSECKECDKASGQNGVLHIASTLTEFAYVVDEIDNDPWLLNVANGTLDLGALELQAPQPGDRITKICAGAYDPDAQGVVWQTFLERVLPDEELRGFVQRLIGMSLIGEVREHILPIFTGSGRNGKGTFYEAVMFAFGDYAATAEPGLFLHRDNAHPTGQMDLLGKRLVVISESDAGARLAEATMKRLTGGDRIKARGMRKDFVEFEPSHLPIMVTNHLPVVSGDDPAVWARLRVVPFAVVIGPDEQDPELRNRLRLEADAIVSWAARGLRDYLDGGLAEPDSVRAATDRYRLDSDPLGRFISERCYASGAVQVDFRELFVGWEQWRMEDGSVPELSKKAFGRALTVRGYGDRKSNGKTWRMGICLQQQDDQ
jgi:putative DNA primase/helicase